MNKIISGFVIAGGIAIIATPILYTKQVNKAIQNNTNILIKNGIKLKEIKNNDSFFSINRQYTITITDITPIIKQLNPNISTINLNDLKQAFNNTKFNMNLNLIKYPTTHKKAAIIYLDSFNDKTMQELKKDKIGKQIISFIKNKGLEFIIDTSSTNISKISLKDIDLKINASHSSSYSDKTETTNILVKNTYLTLNSKIIQNIGNVSIKYNKISKWKSDHSVYKDDFNFNLTNLKYTLNQKNNFNVSTNLLIKNINFNSNKENIHFNLNNIILASNASTITKYLNFNNQFTIQNLSFKSKYSEIDFKNFKINSKFTKIDLPTVQKFVKLSNLYKVNNNKKLQKELQLDIQTLINKGFSFEINPLSIDSIKIKDHKKIFNIQPISITFKTNLINNKFNFNYDKPQYLTKYINADLLIKTKKENIDMISKINPMIVVYLAMVSKQEKNNIIINMTYKNGHIYSKGKKLF